MKSLKIILPVGIVLFFVTGLATHNIRKEAEEKLSKEETITAAVNRQILADQEVRKNEEIEREKARDDFYFKLRLGLKP